MGGNPQKSKLIFLVFKTEKLFLRTVMYSNVGNSVALTPLSCTPKDRLCPICYMDKGQEPPESLKF